MKKRGFWQRMFGSSKHEDVFDDDYEQENEMYEEEEGYEDEYDEEDTKGKAVEQAPAIDLSINVIDKGGKFIVQTFIPGADEDDVDIVVTRELISITVETQEEHCGESDDYVFDELNYGRFTRSIMLPAEVEADDAEANVKDGILTITVPKIDKKYKKKLAVRKK